MHFGLWLSVVFCGFLWFSAASHLETVSAGGSTLRVGVWFSMCSCCFLWFSKVFSGSVFSSTVVFSSRLWRTSKCPFPLLFSVALCCFELFSVVFLGHRWFSVVFCGFLRFSFCPSDFSFAHHVYSPPQGTLGRCGFL